MPDNANRVPTTRGAAAAAGIGVAVLTEVSASIKKELGVYPSELFADFYRTALAKASIAQVHRARTKDGVDVVVKVQQKGIKDIILQVVVQTPTASAALLSLLLPSADLEGDKKTCLTKIVNHMKFDDKRHTLPEK